MKDKDEEFSFGTLIVKAREKAPRNGHPVTVHSKTCTCSVEVAYFTKDSTRENYSRCVKHKLR